MGRRNPSFLVGAFVTIAFSVFILSLGDLHTPHAVFSKLRFDSYADSIRLKERHFRKSCGPLALQRIYMKSGLCCSLADVTRDVAPTIHGSTMLSLIRDARERGLPAAGWWLSFRDLTHAPFPVVAFVNGNHYVVVDTVEATGGVLTYDKWGERRYTREEFIRMWHGETIVFW